MTEVLLAIGIVGIIAALVLPMVVKDYQTKTLDAAIKREKQTIESSIASLLINENTDDYNKTMLYTGETDPSSYANTSGKYITKYLKVSKYCGDNNGDCFASKYYQYESGDKAVYTPIYKGACASLKNGSSICIEPKTPTHGVKILLDINGKKGPNIKGRDLQEFIIGLPEKGSLDRTASTVDWNYKMIEIEPACEDGETTEFCCEKNFTVGCCSAFPEKYASKNECKTCSATKGTDAECCTTSNEYANAHKTSCCSNISTYFNSNKPACCTLNPSDTRCPTPPPLDTYVSYTLSVDAFDDSSTGGYEPGGAYGGTGIISKKVRYRISLQVADSNYAGDFKVLASYCSRQNNDWGGCSSISYDNKTVELRGNSSREISIECEKPATCSPRPRIKEIGVFYKETPIHATAGIVSAYTHTENVNVSAK